MTTTLPEFDSGTATSDIVTALKSSSGAIIRNLVSDAIVDEVYDEVMQNTNAQARAVNTPYWPEGNQTLPALAGVSPTFANNLLTHPTLLDIADAVLLPMVPLGPGSAAPTEEDLQALAMQYVSIGENENGGMQIVMRAGDSAVGPNCSHYRLGASVMLQRHAGEGQPLHRENSIYQPFVEALQMHEFILSAMWAGSDFTRDNGATRLAPGSHLWPEERIAQEHEITQAEMPKGSVVLWLSRSLHGAGTSTSETGRTGFFHSFVPDWFTQEENQYLAVPPERAMKLSETAVRLIGYRCSAGLGWVKGRDSENLLKQGVSGPV